jgi:hypothetical protein
VKVKPQYEIENVPLPEPVIYPQYPSDADVVKAVLRRMNIENKVSRRTLIKQELINCGLTTQDHNIRRIYRQINAELYSKQR